MTSQKRTGSHLETPGRLAGVDLGRVRTGLSVSDPGQQLASPVAVLATEPLLTLGARMAQALDAGGYEPACLAGLVAGLPLEKSGREGAAAAWVREAGEICRHACAAAIGNPGLPLEFVDERFTTRAQERLGKELGFSRRKRSERSDAWAAAAILQSWLDRSRERCS
jgi:putative Holliday junction resolvase